jgi:5-methylcytosine-specific restriction endonuclease McrA
MLVLQLDVDFTPLRLIRWERAVELVLAARAYTVAALPDRFVRSPSLALPWPSVIVARTPARLRPRVGFHPRNVAARDGYRCAYCGIAPMLADGRPDRRALTLDHVVPRAQAREGTVVLPWSRKRVPVHCWENAVAACVRCNQRKADRTPEQAGMTLRTLPRAPRPTDALRIHLARLSSIPEEWRPYLPSGWLAEPRRELVALAG